MSLGDIRVRCEKAHEEISRMCKEAWMGLNPWRWSIPANPDRDSDLILSAPLADVTRLLVALEAVEAWAHELADGPSEGRDDLNQEGVGETLLELIAGALGGKP